MKIVADENIPYVNTLFGELGEIERVDGRSLAAEQLTHADILLVRSVTQVNHELLKDADRLSFIGSATIGVDHLNQHYLGQRGISYTNAPGCNATSVGEYAFIAMLELANRFDEPLKDKVVGIVGCGNTGNAVQKCLTAYGVKVWLYDPFKSEEDTPCLLASLDELIARCDVISLHVPLTTDVYPTHHLFDSDRLASLKLGTWLLNCSRGEVIDNQALIAIKSLRNDLKLVLDVWEGEPKPMAELIPFVDIATPHIAGYSIEGKARGTYILYQALMKKLGISVDNCFENLLTPLWSHQLDLIAVPDEQALLHLVRFIYDIRDDDQRFRQQVFAPRGFDLMRKNYSHRREFSALKVANRASFDVNWLIKMGFSGVKL